MSFCASHLKMTCAGVAPILDPMVFKTVSTGPPGVFVIGLQDTQTLNFPNYNDNTAHT